MSDVKLYKRIAPIASDAKIKIGPTAKARIARQATRKIEREAPRPQSLDSIVTFEAAKIAADIEIVVPPPEFPAELPIRFLREVGTRTSLRVYWGDDCANAYGQGWVGCHNAKVHLIDTDKLEDWEQGGSPSDHPEACWAIKCDHCDAAVPAMPALELCACGCGQMRLPDGAPNRQVSHERIYVTPGTGSELITKKVAGDAWIETLKMHGDDGACRYWDNCNGKHLIVNCPGYSGMCTPWDTNSRANNCTKREDRTHRCWVVTGDPEKGEPIHVSKNGDTCSAGAGSIQAGPYHGVLVHGVLRRC